MDQSTAQSLVRSLAGYNGDNEWEDVIRHGGTCWEVDEAATNEADISNMSDIVVLTDGSRAIWDESAREWRVA
ncbi:MAG: hypothetical protein ACYC5Y_05085 [Symbiobacteriia bacterium]